MDRGKVMDTFNDLYEWVLNSEIDPLAISQEMCAGWGPEYPPHSIPNGRVIFTFEYYDPRLDERGKL